MRVSKIIMAKNECLIADYSGGLACAILVGGQVLPTDSGKMILRRQQVAHPGLFDTQRNTPDGQCVDALGFGHAVQCAALRFDCTLQNGPYGLAIEDAHFSPYAGSSKPNISQQAVTINRLV
ncbi:MAG: hypothetical protein ACRCZ5_03120 [Burkholderiales bacterium]|jgi:hypothetical protein